jgi:futalosine hydrolase
MARRLLIVTAVQQEADAIGFSDSAYVVVGGIGRTNAAVTTTTAIHDEGPFDVVISAGVAGSLPEGELSIGDVVVASSCVYAEEGLITPEGFQDMSAMGFALGDFSGNSVPVDAMLLDRLGAIGMTGSIATVATCSGTDEQAALVADRTGCVCEAMEGAAVVHAARIAGLPAIEIRVISNSTGNREAQKWDLELAFATLGIAINTAVAALQDE